MSTQKGCLNEFLDAVQDPHMLRAIRIRLAREIIEDLSQHDLIIRTMQGWRAIPTAPHELFNNVWAFFEKKTQAAMMDERTIAEQVHLFIDRARIEKERRTT